MKFLEEIYNYKFYYAREISQLDKNSQDLAYTYGVSIMKQKVFLI